MSAFHRAKEDEGEGDLGSARRRLMSHAASVGYEASTCEAIARLSMRMQDPTEAGRWYFLCDSADPDAEAAIRRFADSCGGNPDQIASQLPLVRNMGSGTTMPDAVRQRLSASRISMAALDGSRAGKRARSKPGIGAVLGTLGCLLVALLAIVCLVVGAVTVIAYLRGGK